MSGCTENTSDENSKKDIPYLEVASYTVETYTEDMEKLGEGFIHTNDSYWYLINGIIRNNLKYTTTIRINLSFLDGNDTFLDSTFTFLYNVSAEQEESFLLRTHLDFFEKTEKVIISPSEVH